MTSRVGRAIQSSGAVAVVIGLLSCHVADVMAPVGSERLVVSFVGDSVLVAGTRVAPRVRVTDGGEAVTVPRIRLVSADTSIVGVTAGGDSLLPRRLGTAAITAFVESSLLPSAPPAVTRTAIVVPKTLTLTPGAAQLTAIGDTITLAVTASDAAGSPLGNVPVQWLVSDASRATVVGGRVTAIKAGVVEVRAVHQGRDTARATITVSQQVTRYGFPAGIVTLDAIGAETTLVAVALDANGHPIDGASVAPVWESADTSRLVVQPDGRARAVANGTAWVRARRPDGRADSTLVAVDQRAVRVSILTPRGTSMSSALDTLTLAARAWDRLDQTVTDVPPRWVSRNTNVVQVDPSQGRTVTATGLNADSTWVVATLDAGADSVKIVVLNEPASVTITPESPTLASANDSLPFFATVRNAAGGSVPGAVVTWSTPDLGVAKPIGGGMFVAVDSGVARVIARVTTARGTVVADTSFLTVTNVPALVRMLVANDTLIYLGDTLTPPIRIENARRDPLPRTRVLWQSRPTGIVSVTDAGFVTALATGTTWLIASGPVARDSMRLTVTNLAASVTIDGLAAGVVDTMTAPGQTLVYTATVRDASGNVVPFPMVWSSSTEAVVSVNNGSVTATGFGPAQVVVRAGAVADTASVLVRDATRWIVDVARAGTTQFGTFARPFAKIGMAEPRATAGDTIAVFPGAYIERLVTNKTITLAGDSTDFLATGRDPLRLPSIVNADGAGAIRLHGGVADIRHLVLKNTSPGPALEATFADVILTNVYVNPGQANTPQGSGIVVSEAKATVRTDSVSVEGVIGYGIRVTNSAGVRIQRARVRGVDAAGTGAVEDGAGIAVLGGRGAIISANNVRTTAGAQVALIGTDGAAAANNRLTGERQLMLVRGATGTTTVTDNVFDLARPADDPFTGNSTTDGRAGLTIVRSTGVQVNRNTFRDAGGSLSLMDAVRVDSSTGLRLEGTHVSGARRAVRATRSSWQLSRVRIDSTAIAIESVDDTVTMVDDTLATAGTGCIDAQRASLTATRLVLSGCGTGDRAPLELRAGLLDLDGLTLDGSSSRGLIVTGAARAIVRRATVRGPATSNFGPGRAALELAADSLVVTGSLVTGYGDRAGIVAGGRYVRVDSSSVNLTRRGVVIDSARTLVVRDADLFDADSAALVVPAGTSVSAPGVWWGDGRGPRGTSPLTVGDTVNGPVSTSGWRVDPLRPGTQAKSIRGLRGEGMQILRSTVSTLPMSVRVTDRDGRPVAGVTVTFKLPNSSAGSFVLNSPTGPNVGRTATVTTNSSGLAEVYLKVGSSMSVQYPVTASAPGASPDVTMTAISF
ncbi:MAG TPA: right-handed parallel beta-helix repeat-containing protein [Gemmatimonadaceae bacterium]|nr:right-handed parallel beta-helix repeat-containing protein [Gemmatimonadaceae bacterium]